MHLPSKIQAQYHGPAGAKNVFLSSRINFLFSKKLSEGILSEGI